MTSRTRREFFKEVGAGMLTAAVGSGMAGDLGLSPVFASEGDETLTFGKFEPLVALMQETPPGKLQASLVKKFRSGEASLRRIVAAAALANARTFGGDDYVGFHTMFALMPAYSLAQDLPRSHQLLPVLKVVYRNSSQIQRKGGRAREVLRPVRACALPEGRAGGEVLREAIRRKDLKGAEQAFAALSRSSAVEAFNQLQTALHDSTEVHRVNVVYRAWGLLEVVGREHAHTMLRQSVHYFVRQESGRSRERFSGARALLPKLIDEYHLFDRLPARRPADDAWVERMSRTLFEAPPERAAEAAAGALAEGFGTEAVHEAVSLAANQLVLRDRNPKAHGNTVGVHACDAVNAWRNIGRASDPRNAVAGAILAAYHVAFDRDHPSRNRFLEWDPYPLEDARARVKTDDPGELLRRTEDAIRGKDQALASALIDRYGKLQAPPGPVFKLLRRHVLSEDGALHGEKFFGTVAEEFGAARPPFRWRQLVGMARYAASMVGEPAPGMEEARRLLEI